VNTVLRIRDVYVYVRTQEPDPNILNPDPGSENFFIPDRIPHEKWDANLLYTQKDIKKEEFVLFICKKNI
jgi:hypothetical protein